MLAVLVSGSTQAAVKMRMVLGRPVVQGVYVNGHGPYAFLLDTGTTANHLDQKLAQSIGLKATFRSELVSSAGSVYTPGTDGVEVALDSVSAQNQRFLFAGGDVLHKFAPDIQGILGQAFLSHFDYLVDMRGKRIEFGAGEPTSSAVRAPLHTSEARPMVPTNLGALVLDSGTRWVTLFGVASARVTGEMTTLAGSLKLGTVSRKLLIEGHTFWTGSALAVPQSAEAGAEGLLPVSLFKSVYFSNSSGFVGFE